MRVNKEHMYEEHARRRVCKKVGGSLNKKPVQTSCCFFHAIRVLLGIKMWVGFQDCSLNK